MIIDFNVLIRDVETARDAIKSWKSTYRCRDTRPNDMEDICITHKKGKQTRYNKLLNLGDNPDPDDVDKIIGNKGWTTFHCDMCGDDANQVIKTPIQTDWYEIFLCLNCSKKIVEGINKTLRGGQLLTSTQANQKPS